MRSGVYGYTFRFVSLCLLISCLYMPSYSGVFRVRAQELCEGCQARSKDQEILEEGGGSGLRKLDFFCFELSKLFVNSSATDIVFVTLPKHSS